MNNKWVPVCAHSCKIYIISTGSSPAVSSVDHKNGKLTSHYQSVRNSNYWQVSTSVFAEIYGLYVMIYEQNGSLQVSSGPDIAFQLSQVTQTESKHKNLLSGFRVTRLMAALQGKSLFEDSSSSSFLNSVISGPAPIDILSRTTTKSALLGLWWSSKVDAETWTLLEHGIGWRLFEFRNKLHWNIWVFR